MKTDNNNMKEILMMSVFEVFEKMYYIFLEPRAPESSDTRQRAVTIRFSGASNGEMQAYYSEALAEAMVENALGMDKVDISDQVMEDCLKESVNMVCGNFLQKMEPDKVLQLSLPRYEGKVSVPRDAGDPEIVQMAFESDGMAMDVVFKKTEAMN